MLKKIKHAPTADYLFALYSARENYQVWDLLYQQPERDRTKLSIGTALTHDDFITVKPLGRCY